MSHALQKLRTRQRNKNLIRQYIALRKKLSKPDAIELLVSEFDLTYETIEEIIGNPKNYSIRQLKNYYRKKHALGSSTD